MQNGKQQIKEDVWIPTHCARCYGVCAMKVHRVNGVAVEIQGEPNSTLGSEGGLCPKGFSSLHWLYDPNRLNVPLKRTNPEKGIGVDPKWKEITWDEAYEEIVSRMEKLIKEKKANKIMGSIGGTSYPGQPTGAPMYLGGLVPMQGFVSGVGLHCGDAAHPVGGLIHGSWSIVPDFKYCNYALYFGSSKGHGSGHSAMHAARLVADARLRGMKLVVFDPMCNTASGKAQEWVPIIPGTDLAAVLAMCNVIVNELKMVDIPFLKLKTNGPYLLDSNNMYVRENGPARGVKGHTQMGATVTYVGDDETNKPMVWDAGEGKAKVYDDPTVKDYALEGNYEFRGIKCQPGFQVLKNHLKQYTPEWASPITSIPAEAIRRIATEFATEARIGSTITIQDHVLPYRPVAVVIFRGGQGHENSYHAVFAVNLLAELVGAIEVPGGVSSWPPVTMGYPGHEDDDEGAFKWTVFKGLDGFLQNQRFGPSSGASNKNNPYHGEWPIALPEMKHDWGLKDIQPLGGFKYIAGGSDRDEIWKKVGATYDSELMILAKNPVLSVGDRDAICNALKKVKYLVVVELFNSETTEAFADLVLPDTMNLEKDNWASSLAQNFNHAWGMDDWVYHISQKVVEPMGQRKHSYDMAYDIAERLGKRLGKDLITEANTRSLKSWPIKKEYWPKDLSRKISVAEFGDAFCKSSFGPDKGWEWFKKNGFVRWPKKVEEAYWIWYIPLRVPLFPEWLAHFRPIVEKINKETGIGFDVNQFTPMITWFPCTNHKVTDPNYDLYCYSYRDVLHSASSTMEQPCLDEASRMNPYTYNITMNANTAQKKGLKDGDKIEVETYKGRKVTGTLKTLQGHQPLCVGIAATAGHWAEGQPIAKGKGTNFDNLMPLDWEHTDPVCGSIETSVRVNVRKIG